MNREEHIADLNLDGLKTEPLRVLEEPEGATWVCPRCSYYLDMTAEGATMELWECARCGYLKVLKGGAL